MHKDNVVNKQSDTYIEPPKDVEGYLIPNKESEKLPFNKYSAAGDVYMEGLHYVPPFTSTPNYLSAVEDEQAEDQKIETLPDSTSKDPTQSRKLPEVPVHGGQFYDEIIKPASLDNKGNILLQ